MGFWICFNCGSHNVYEKMYVRLNRLACIIDDVEDLMVIEDNTHEYCSNCHKDVMILLTTAKKSGKIYKTRNY